MSEDKKRITVAVGYGWQKFEEEDFLSEDMSLSKKTVAKGYEVLHDQFWKSIKEKFITKFGGISKTHSVEISFSRLRASHGKLVWQSILEKIKQADVLIFDIAQPPATKGIPEQEVDIKDVVSSFNANVLVEIGVALGWDKRVMLMCPSHLFDKVPSDLKGYLWTTYTGKISKENFVRTFCDERGALNAFMGMLREAIREKYE